MNRPTLSSLAPLLPALLWMSGCGDLFVVLTVEDPDELADRATVLRIGEDTDTMVDFPLDGESFPITQTQAAGSPGDRLVWVDVADAAGVVLGRDRVTLTFEAGRDGTARAILQAPCEESADCDDGVFCNGAETCTDGRVCVAGNEPCPASIIQCVDQACDEAASTCTTEVDHSLCDGLQYCNPAVGCVEGDPCTENGTAPAECQDGFTCNGSERCEGFRCVAGIPPTVDDDNDCTLDSCAEPGGALNTPVPDGNACTRPGGGSGICLTGACVSTGCGDGFVDLSQDEECDDGADNSDAVPNACRSDCRAAFCGDGVLDLGEDCDDGNIDNTDACVAGCKVASCGDGFVQAGVDECDDGVLNSDANVDACRKDCVPATCGDGVVDTGEACDDGDAEDTDGCLTTCEANTCGDGFPNFGVEQCDDGNDDDTDGCVQGCKNATCGDAFVHAGVEQCDDGNAVSTDNCLPGCVANVCGDGVRNVAAEACDDGNMIPRDGCSERCDFVRWRVDLGSALDPDAMLVAWSYVHLVPAPPPDAPDAGPPVDGGGPDGGAGDAGAADAGSADGGVSDAGPVLIEETVDVVGAVTLAGDVVALDLRDGTELWRWSSGGSFRAPLIVGSHGVYGIYDDDATGVVVAFDTTGPIGGDPRWTAALDLPSGGSSLTLAIGDLYPGKPDQIFAVDENAKLYHINGADGAAMLFDYSAHGPVRTYPHSTDTRDYDATATCDRCKLTSTGTLYGGTENFMPAGLILPLGEKVWLWNFYDNCAARSFALPAGDEVLGHLIWRGDARNNQEAVNDPAHYTTALGGTYSAYSDDIGSTCDSTFSLMQFARPTQVASSPSSTPPAIMDLPSGSILVVGDANGKLHAYGAQLTPPTGQPPAFVDNPGWPIDLGAPLRVPAALGGSFGVYAADEDGQVHAITTAGEVRWVQDLGAAPAGSPMVGAQAVFAGGQDGVVWAFERGEAEPFPNWWSRQGAGNKGTGMTINCDHTGVGGAPPLACLAVVVIGGLLSRRRRCARRDRQD